MLPFDPHIPATHLPDEPRATRNPQSTNRAKRKHWDIGGPLLRYCWMLESPAVVDVGAPLASRRARSCATPGWKWAATRGGRARVRQALPTSLPRRDPISGAAAYGPRTARSPVGVP